MESETTIVYVGPETDASSDVVRGLRDVGDRVTVVETPAEPPDRLSTAACVVVSDTLAGVDPVEFCAAVRRHHPDLPVVVFPAHGSESLAGEAVAAGADGYVPRSAGIDTLARRVSGVLEDAESPAGAEVTPDETSSSGSDETASKLELLVDQSPLAIIEWTLDFEVANWNAAATELFGYTEAEARGEYGPALLAPESDREALSDHWNRLRNGTLEEGPIRRTGENLRKDGSTVACEWFCTPLVDTNGEVVSVLSFIQDVSAERARADALEALQETTHDLMRAGSAEEIASIVIDATEHVIDRPLAALRLYDDERHTLELAEVTSKLDAATGDIESVGPEEYVLWEAYRGDDPVVIDDVSTEKIPYEIDIDVGNSILQPLGDHGLLAVASTSDDRLDVADIHLVHVLATTAEAALDRAARERELERTKTIVETVGDGVYALDRDGTFVTVNDRLVEMTGYEQSELVGEHVSNVLTEESLTRGRSRIAELCSADENRVATYEITLVARDGTHVPCEVNTTLLQAEETLEGSVGIVRDISDRKRMERELVRRKAKIEALHEVASELDDCESRAEIFERTVDAAEDVLEFDVCVVDSYDDGHLVKAAVSSTLDDEFERRMSIDEGIAGKTYRTQETYRIDDIRTEPDAVPQDVSFRSVLSVPIGEWGVFQTVSTDVGSFSREDEELAELLLSHVTDALDRIAFEERLRTERDRFVALFENVPDAVVSARRVDGEAVVDSVNPAFERLFGYDEETVEDDSLEEYIVPANGSSEAEALAERGSNGEVVEAEVKRRTADGLRDFMMRVVPIEVDEPSNRSFNLYTDITEQKQRQKRVEILNRVLRHDMRNGMNIIGGCAEMLAEAVEDDDVEYAQTIQERASELVSLAEKTRAVERVLERDKTMVPTDLNDAVADAVSRLRTGYPDVNVTCSISDRTYVRASGSLETAIYQVLENAAEHSDTASPTIEISARDRPDDGMLAISIADDGPGMPDEERELLQGDREITQLHHASGLGLWLVNLVVTQSGGQLTFESNEPRGTVVTLELPPADSALIQLAGDGTATSD